MLERLTFDDFKPLEGSAFRVAEPPVELILASARQVMESERARLSRQPFSLFFRGPLDAPLAQRIYTLTHPRFEEPLSIFLVPIGRNAQGFDYEAVFT